MTYNNQPTTSGHQRPLLMGFSRPTPIEIEDTPSFIIYDPMNQQSQMDMRIIGTYSLRSRSTQKRTPSGGTGYATDKKNEIDDQKYVK